MEYSSYMLGLALICLNTQFTAIYLLIYKCHQMDVVKGQLYSIQRPHEVGDDGLTCAYSSHV